MLLNDNNNKNWFLPHAICVDLFPPFVFFPVPVPYSMKIFLPCVFCCRDTTGQSDAYLRVVFLSLTTESHGKSLWISAFSVLNKVLKDLVWSLHTTLVPHSALTVLPGLEVEQSTDVSNLEVNWQILCVLISFVFSSMSHSGTDWIFSEHALYSLRQDLFANSSFCHLVGWLGTIRYDFNEKMETIGSNNSPLSLSSLGLTKGILGEKKNVIRVPICTLSWRNSALGRRSIAV